MKTEQPDRIQELFHEIKMEKTSDEFMKRMMFRIEKEAIAKKQKKQLNIYLLMAAGIAGILAIPATIIYFMGIDLREVYIPNISQNLRYLFKGLNIDPSIIFIGLIILLLLIGDSLMRKFIGHKRSSHRTDVAV